MVGAAALLAGAAVLAYHRPGGRALFFRTPGGGASEFLGSGGGADDTRDRLLAEVAAHPFWKVKVTEARVAELAAAAREADRGRVLYVSERGEAEVRPGRYDAESEAWVRLAAPAFGDGVRYAMVDTRRYASRPSEETVLRDLKADMGWAEYHRAPEAEKRTDPFAPILGPDGLPVPMQERSPPPPGAVRNPRGPRPRP